LLVFIKRKGPPIILKINLPKELIDYWIFMEKNQSWKKLNIQYGNI